MDFLLKKINQLAVAVPQIKRDVLNACVQTVAADGVIQETEAELLRAIADTLDCPMPPFVEAIRGEELARDPSVLLLGEEIGVVRQQLGAARGADDPVGARWHSSIVAQTRGAVQARDRGRGLLTCHPARPR